MVRAKGVRICETRHDLKQPDYLKSSVHVDVSLFLKLIKRNVMFLKLIKRNLMFLKLIKRNVMCVSFERK